MYEEPDMPLYNKFITETQGIEKYYWNENILRSKKCLEHFNQEVEKFYNIHKLSNFIKDWTNQYVLIRCKTVLAFVIQKSLYDGRYETGVKNNAITIKISNKSYEELYSNVHSVVINFAYKNIMKIEAAKKKTVHTANKERYESER